MKYESLEEVSIKFQGFSPSTFTRGLLLSLINELHAQAPYGAKINTSLEKTNGRFQGVVSINSAVGSFFALAKETHVKETVENMVIQIKKQLAKWKSRRFETAGSPLANYAETAGCA